MSDDTKDDKPKHPHLRIVTEDGEELEFRDPETIEVKPGANNKQATTSSPRLVVAKERKARAVTMRARGMSYRQIAEELGYKSAEGAAKAVRRAMGQIPKEDSDRLTTMQAERYNALLSRVWAGVEEGDKESITLALKIMDAQGKLHGLNAPKEVKVEANSTSSHTESILVLDGGTEDYIKHLQRAVGFTPTANKALPAAGEEVLEAEVIE